MRTLKVNSSRKRVKGSQKNSKRSRKKRRVPHLSKPPQMDLHDWQLALRRQAGDEQRLIVRNLGPDPVFSEFAVRNPATKKAYRVVIRGETPGVNFCSCPDYAVNTLGTCKHIEATLRRVRRGHSKQLRNGYQPPFPEVYVRYGAQRTIMFSPGENYPPPLQRMARGHFQADGSLKSTW